MTAGVLLGMAGSSCAALTAHCQHPHSPRCSQNAEIFTLTYGSMVRQLIADYEDVEEVNKQLDKM